MMSATPNQKRILFLILCCFVLLTACVESPRKNPVKKLSGKAIPASTEKPVEIKKLKNVNLELHSFKGLPSEIEGCSCYFSETKADFEADRYVFAANYDSLAIVSVNGKKEYFNMVSSGRDEHSFGDYDHTDLYESADYKLKVIILYDKRNGDETWWNTGTIELKNKKGQKTTRKFVGECGC